MVDSGYEVEPGRIAELWTARTRDSDAQLQRMRRVRDAYNGEIVLPVDVDSTDPAIANQILIGIDQTADRISSVVPQVTCPPLRPGDRSSERRAATRRKAMLGWWEASGGKRLLRERGRYLTAYASSPVTIWPNFKEKRPEWRVRNPLVVLPNTDIIAPFTPADTITQINRPFRWLKVMYPDAAMALPPETLPDQQVVLLEYNDHEQSTLILTGLLPSYEQGQITAQWDTSAAGGMAEVLESVPNRIGVPWSVTPWRTSLDRPQGQFDQAVGVYQAQARLAALSMTKVERDVFPDTYLVARPAEVPKFIEGPYDGRSGKVNVISGGDIKELTGSPNYNTDSMVDRLERATRGYGVPADFTGESASNVRTGRRGDSILSSTIDFPIAHAQDALAEAMQEENRRAAQIAKTYFGGATTSFYLTLAGKPTKVTYNARQVFEETDENRVTYPVAGSDMNQLIVGMGQRLGLGVLSRKSFMENDSMVADTEEELDRITSESLDDALRSTILAQAQAGVIPPLALAEVSRLVRQDRMDLADAVVKVQEDMAAEQAGAAEAQAGMVNAMQPMAPGAAGGPAGVGPAPTVGETPQGMQNLAGMLTTLRKTGGRAATRQALG